ncbi:MAG TPA: iron chelate uptake ABC transporter family permease subunit [Verrucomicrobiae bacterium]|jgi:zinc/manganese transport system permease protein
MGFDFQLMLYPLLACLLLPAMLVYLGLHIVRREIIFVDLALAQVAALGTSVCLMLGHDAHDVHTYFWSLGFTFLGAFIFAMTRNHGHHRVPQEALIGIVYVVAAAAAILVLDRSNGGNEELKKTLVGDVLTVTWAQVWKTSALYAAIAVVHFIFRKQFFLLSFEPQRASLEGMSVRWWDFLFYALFGLVVTSFVQIGGVLLVFSYLIVPAVCAALLATRLRVMLLIGWLIATVGGIAGLFASWHFNFPTGSAIVCVLGLALVLTGIAARLVRRRA